MIGPKIGELFKKILQKTLRYYSVLRRPSHSDGDWDADARATSQFRPGHGAGASGMFRRQIGKQRTIKRWCKRNVNGSQVRCS